VFRVFWVCGHAAWWWQQWWGGVVIQYCLVRNVSPPRPPHQGHPTKAQSPQLTGRAAEFIEYSNIILANQDFKGFQDLFKYFTDRYELPDERMKQVRHSILENVEQPLMEAVAGVLSFKHDPHWGGAYQQGLTKEALSAVVMQRFGSVKAIEDGLQGDMKR
jgi:hypothetical protein